MLDNEKTGELIRLLRKEQGLTQQELAERIGTTDKAVSKWERGAGCPDVAVLVSLAEALGVTADEILRGERLQPPQPEPPQPEPPQPEQPQSEQPRLEMGFAPGVRSAFVPPVLSPDKPKREKKPRRGGRSGREIAVALISAVFLAAALICLVCDVSTSRSVSWSLIVAGALLLVWLPLMALLRPCPHRVRAALICLSILLMAFLALVHGVIPPEYQGWLLPVGWPVALLCLALLWMLYGLFVFLRLGRQGLSSAGEPERRPRRMGKDIATYVVSALLLTTAFICVLCDYAVGRPHMVNWSLIVIGALLLAWIPFELLLYAKKHRTVWALAGFSLLLVLFLWLVELVLRGMGGAEPFFMEIGLPIAAIGLGYLWILCLLASFTRLNTWYLTAVGLALLPLVNLGIDGIVENGNPNWVEALVFSALLAAAVVLALTGWFVNRKKKARAGEIEKAVE